MGELALVGSTRSPVPPWARAHELVDLPVRRSRVNGSFRVAVVLSADGTHDMILKLIGGAQQPATERRAEILASIRRAAQIRASHHALAELIDVRWLPGHGYVTLSERLPGRKPLATVSNLPLKRTLVVAMHVLDALAHIHHNGSCHGDVSSNNVLMTASDEGYLIDYDLADPSLELRRTHYALAHLGSQTLAAWQAADLRAFAMMLAVWLRLRRAALFVVANTDGEREAELRSIRLLAAPLAIYAAATDRSAYELSTEMSQAMRRMIL